MSEIDASLKKLRYNRYSITKHPLDRGSDTNNRKASVTQDLLFSGGTRLMVLKATITQ